MYFYWRNVLLHWCNLWLIWVFFTTHHVYSALQTLLFGPYWIKQFCFCSGIVVVTGLKARQRLGVGCTHVHGALNLEGGSVITSTCDKTHSRAIKLLQLYDYWFKVSQVQYALWKCSFKSPQTMPCVCVSEFSRQFQMRVMTTRQSFSSLQTTAGVIALCCRHSPCTLNFPCSWDLVVVISTSAPDAPRKLAFWNDMQLEIPFHADGLGSNLQTLQSHISHVSMTLQMNVGDLWCSITYHQLMAHF